MFSVAKSVTINWSSAPAPVFCLFLLWWGQSFAQCPGCPQRRHTELEVGAEEDAEVVGRGGACVGRGRPLPNVVRPRPPFPRDLPEGPLPLLFPLERLVIGLFLPF